MKGQCGIVIVKILYLFLYVHGHLSPDVGVDIPVLVRKLTKNMYIDIYGKPQIYMKYHQDFWALNSKTLRVIRKQ